MLLALANTVDVRAVCERFQATKMIRFSKIKQGCRMLIKNNFVNGQFGAEYLVILLNINVTVPTISYNQFFVSPVKT